MGAVGAPIIWGNAIECLDLLLLDAKQLIEEGHCGECQFKFKARPKSAPIDNH